MPPPPALKAFQRIDARLVKLKAEHDAALVQLRSVCPHAHIVECDYRPMDFGSAMPPRRVCVDCGLAEDGWGSYRKLRQPDEYQDSLRERIPLVSRDVITRRTRFVASHYGAVGGREPS